MPDRERIERGLAFEARVAELLGGALRPGSGNQFHAKGDVARVILFSCKAEAARSWAQTRRELNEAVDYAVGTGLSPALAVLDDDGAEVVVMRLSDLAEVLSGDARLEHVKSNGEQRAERAAVPGLLRELGS